jgi:ariadne-1
MTCPDSTCKEVVTEIEVEKAAPECLERFQTFQLQNYVESNKLTRWCPGTGCERVACASTPVAMEQDGGVVHCGGCSTSFCMVCGEEPHGPTSCMLLGRWKNKCQDESETANWILANTKQCPKCSTRIEKNMGCNHMTCRKCHHQFCWICLEDWKSHTGGHYSCNKYDPSKTNETQNAKQELERYLHYYKRYQAHHEAQKFAKKQLEETESKRFQESLKSSKWTDSAFLKAANAQLVECRRVLKYTYIYAFYIDSSTEMAKQRFEHHQEMLEKFTENLSHESEKPIEEMDQAAVVNQTAVVDRFIKNILKCVDEAVG